MKLWGIVIFTVVIASSVTAAATLPDAVPVKDSEGKIYAVVVTCADCQSPASAGKKGCHAGVEEGWLNGQPCGKCLVNQNAGTKFQYPYDIQITGTLVDAAGQPMKERFVKMFMSNGWSVRTRTVDDGKFRLVLGAMDERKTHTPLVIDIGTRVDSKEASEAHYALYFLPESYKSCPPGAAKRTPKPAKKK